jgi:hypothetical protein
MAPTTAFKALDTVGKALSTAFKVLSTVFKALSTAFKVPTATVGALRTAFLAPSTVLMSPHPSIWQKCKHDCPDSQTPLISLTLLTR